MKPNHSAASSLERSNDLPNPPGDFFCLPLLLERQWTAEKNQQVFGRCANRNGHGHNYTLEVTVAGEPDPVTGFVVDLKWLKDVMEQKSLPPSIIAISTWKSPSSPKASSSPLPKTSPSLPGTASPRHAAAGGAKLTSVRIYETPEIFAEYRG